MNCSLICNWIDESHIFFSLFIYKMHISTGIYRECCSRKVCSWFWWLTHTQHTHCFRIEWLNEINGNEQDEQKKKINKMKRKNEIEMNRKQRWTSTKQHQKLIDSNWIFGASVCEVNGRVFVYKVHMYKYYLHTEYISHAHKHIVANVNGVFIIIIIIHFKINDIMSCKTAAVRLFSFFIQFSSLFVFSFYQ